MVPFSMSPRHGVSETQLLSAGSHCGITAIGASSIASNWWCPSWPELAPATQLLQPTLTLYAAYTPPRQPIQGPGPDSELAPRMPIARKALFWPH
jgi:hypothetical protein